MGEVTAIEWTDHTWNPWIGCTKVSPACDNCYAENLMDTRYGRVAWGAGEDRSRTAPSNWKQPARWNREAENCGTRPFVFCASLADIFDNEVDPMWRRDAIKVWQDTPNLVWLPLTKRIGNVVKMIEALGVAWPENAAIGATFANQDEWDRDGWKLADAKDRLGALFSFGSFEPLLSAVTLGTYIPDWVIVGGESGHNARPMSLAWPRTMMAETIAAGRVFNFKQVGGRGPDKGGHTLDGQTHFNRPVVSLPTGGKR